LTENDPTVEAEQHRLQQMESNLLTQGQPVPVSPRDNHMIHLQTLMPLAEQVAGAVMQGQAPTAVFEVVVAHISEHFARAQEQGLPKDQLKPVEEFLRKAGPTLAQLKQIDEQAAQVAAQSAAHDEQSQQLIEGPPTQNGQPTEQPV
jgi:dsRNA-specific ribonuclease